MMKTPCWQRIISWTLVREPVPRRRAHCLRHSGRDHADPESITGQYLSGKKRIPVPETRRIPTGWIKVLGAQENNLKNVDVEIPLGVMTCVTGVSGSGKSSLVNEILYKHLAKSLNRARKIPGEHDGIDGIEQLDKIIDIDQSPIGRTPRSNPATYTGVFDLIRDLFAATADAKAKGYKKGRFSLTSRADAVKRVAEMESSRSRCISSGCICAV